MEKLIYQSRTTPKIVYRGLKTPDGTIIESNYGHDFKTYTDKNGKWYMIDGGREEYGRTSANGDELFITLTDNMPIVLLRQYVTWGKNYDENNVRLPQTEWIKLSDLNDDHLDKLCLFAQAPDTYRKLFIREKQFRNYLNEII